MLSKKDVERAREHWNTTHPQPAVSRSYITIENGKKRETKPSDFITANMRKEEKRFKKAYGLK